MLAALMWLRARADNVAVGLLAAMFIAFVLQIVSRYVFNAPIDWTLELCLTTWLWVVFWEGAFLLDDRDHIKFDLVYQAGRRRARRTMSFGAALAIIIGFGAALPATLGYIGFEKIRYSATLHIRLDYVFSVFGLFMVSVIIRYLWRLWQIVRGVDSDPPEVGTGQ